MQIMETNKMALIGSINDIPLFSTVKEAVAWADANGFGNKQAPKNWHAHLFNGKEGFMGGNNHAIVAPADVENIASEQTTTYTTSTTGGSSGGGGGGY